MKLLVVFAIVALLTEVFARENTTVSNLKPRWYYMLQLNDLTKNGIQARNTETILVKYFIPGVINDDITVCDVDNLSLISGAYTLFVFNDHFLEQNVFLTHTQEGPLIIAFIISWIFVVYAVKNFWNANNL